MVALLLRNMGRIAVGSAVGLCARPVCQGSMGTRSGRAIPYTNIDNRVVAKVLIAADDGVALLILEAHARAARGSRVETVEVLDGGDDGLGGVMGVDLDPHGYARTVLMGVLNQLELDGPRDGWLVVLRLSKLHDAGVSTH